MKNEIQGQDPKGNVFSDLYPLLYAAETPISGAYAASSMVGATIADALVHGGLRDCRVLDVGCGYGTTTAALANFAPGNIVAIDNSGGMIQFFRDIINPDVDLWLKYGTREAEDVLATYWSRPCCT